MCHENNDNDVQMLLLYIHLVKVLGKDLRVDIGLNRSTL